MFAIKVTLSFILTFMVREYQNMLLKRNNSNTYILDYFLPIEKVKKVSCICTAIEYQSNTLPKRDNFNLPIPDHF